MGQRRDEKSRRMGLWSETWMWGEVARCSRERREREESRGGESAWPRNKEVAPPRRHKGRKVRQAFTKFYQKHSSFALHKRKTQKNTIPTGERGQAGNRRIQNSKGFNLYFYFFIKRCYTLLPGLGITLRKQPQADILSRVEAVPNKSQNF